MSTGLLPALKDANNNYVSVDPIIKNGYETGITNVGTPAMNGKRSLNTGKAVIMKMMAAFFVENKLKRFALALLLVLVVSFVRAQEPVVTSDSMDYQPGSPVIFIGSGFQTG